MGFSSRTVSDHVNKSFKGSKYDRTDTWGEPTGSTAASSGGRRSPRSRGRTGGPVAARTNPSSSGQGKKNKKNYPDITEWAIAAGLKVAYDEFGKALLTEQIVDSYMETFGNAERYTRPNGKFGYRDKGTGKDVTSGTAAGAKASAAAASAGIGSLFNSYLRDGELDSKDYMTAGSAAGVSGGQSYVNTNFDFAKTPGGGAAVSAGFAGLGNAAAQYINTGKVDAGKVGIAAGGAAAGKMAGSAVLAQGGSSAAAGAAGGVWAGVVQAGVELKQDRGVSKGTEWGIIGGLAGTAVGTAFGGVGAPVGAAIGSFGGNALAYATGADKVAAKYAYTYDSPDGKDGIYYDAETGLFKTAKPTDVRVTFRGADPQGGQPKGAQKNAILSKRYSKMQDEVALLQKDISNFDGYGAIRQVEIEDNLKGHSRKAFQTEEEYRNGYEEFKKAQENYKPMDNEVGGLGESLHTYEAWKKSYDETKNTALPMDASIFDKYKGEEKSSLGRYKDSELYQSSVQASGGIVDPVHGSLLGDGIDGPSDYELESRGVAADKFAQDMRNKVARGEQLTPRQLEAMKSLETGAWGVERRSVNQSSEGLLNMPWETNYTANPVTASNQSSGAGSGSVNAVTTAQQKPLLVNNNDIQGKNKNNIERWMSSGKQGLIIPDKNWENPEGDGI